jgi:cell division protein FtsQ
MARKGAGNAPSSASPPLHRAGRTVLEILVLSLRVGVGLAAVVGVVWGYTTTERYLARGDRFTLQPPADGEGASGFELHGMRYGSEHKVLNVFAPDFGRSVYLCPIAERRRQLLAIDWVAEAMVQRIWPDRIVVRIRERNPVAYVEVPGPRGSELASLIDADGVLLDPQRTQLALPVIAGIDPSEQESSRAEKVRRFLQLQTELGPHMQNISEIDVADVDNTRLVQSFDGRAITLVLGGGEFGRRYQKFLDNAQHIREHLPHAVTLDLRLKNRIMAVSEPVASPSASGEGKKK